MQSFRLCPHSFCSLWENVMSSCSGSCCSSKEELSGNSQVLIIILIKPDSHRKLNLRRKTDWASSQLNQCEDSSLVSRGFSSFRGYFVFFFFLYFIFSCIYDKCLNHIWGIIAKKKINWLISVLISISALATKTPYWSGLMKTAVSTYPTLSDNNNKAVQTLLFTAAVKPTIAALVSQRATAPANCHRSWRRPTKPPPARYLPTWVLTCVNDRACCESGGGGGWTDVVVGSIWRCFDVFLSDLLPRQSLHSLHGKIGGPRNFSVASWELWGGDSWVTSWMLCFVTKHFGLGGAAVGWVCC